MSDKNENKPQKPWSRRSFIQTAAMTAATLALPGCSRKEKPVLSTLTGDFDPLRAIPTADGKTSTARSGPGTKWSAPRIPPTVPVPAVGTCTCATA